MLPVIAPATHGTTLAPELCPSDRLNSCERPLEADINESGVGILAEAGSRGVRESRGMWGRGSEGARGRW